MYLLYYLGKHSTKSISTCFSYNSGLYCLFILGRDIGTSRVCSIFCVTPL